jgi:hypothetical protein
MYTVTHYPITSLLVSSLAILVIISLHLLELGAQSANPGPNKSKTTVSRDFSANNINNFKRDL